MAKTWKRKEGHCHDCQCPLLPTDTQRCAECRAKKSIAVQKLRKRRKEESVCLTCGDPNLVAHGEQKACFMCYLKRTAKKNLGSHTRWKELRDLFDKQKGICPYTGKVLQMGVDASVDHIKPRGRYPELANDIDNVEWIDYDINVMKRDRTKEEFLEIIKKIHDINFT